MQIISPWTLYLVLKLDTFHNVLVTTTVIAGCLWAIIFIFAWGVGGHEDSFSPKEKEENKKLSVRLLKRLAVVFFVFLVGSAALPTTKEAAILLTVPSVVNSPVVQQLPSEVFKYVDKRLDQILGPIDANKHAD